MAALIYHRQLEPGDAASLAQLRRTWARADGHDELSIGIHLPTGDELEEELRAAEVVVIARDSAAICGYGRVVSWDETDGTRVHLLDTHSAPGSDRAAVDEALLLDLEKRVPHNPHRSEILGVNAEVTDLGRVRVLTVLGYRPRLELVELELRDAAPGGTFPLGVTVREPRPADADAEAIANLTEEIWAGRPYFRGLPVDEVAAWLSRADPALFVIAEADGDLIGLAVGNITDAVVEIDDLGIRPDWRRRGLATALMSELLDRIGARSTLPVRLLTEGADPAGARSLYHRLGFATVARHGRYAKPVGS